MLFPLQHKSIYFGDTTLVQEGLQNIAGKFRSPDDYGSSRAILFIGDGTRDKQEIARRDAYERAAYFL